MRERNYQLNMNHETVKGNGCLFASPIDKKILFSWNYPKHIFLYKII